MFSRHDSERAIWLEYKGNAKGGSLLPHQARYRQSVPDIWAAYARPPTSALCHIIPFS